MCLFPIIKRNPKYTPNKKNGGVVPTPRDGRVLAVPIACGKCIECRKKKAREWQVRLHEEIRDDPNALFMTMTFSEEALETFQCDDANEVASKAVRLFIKRWVKKYGESVKHWLVTELGHKDTERLHLHGFLWTDKTCDEIQKIWKYGIVDTGEYVNHKSVGYVVKYVSKVDPTHKEYISKVFASKGIGKGYIKRYEAQKHKFKETETNEIYRAPNGVKMGLPIYYRNKLWTEYEREQLWLQKLDKQERYVLGQKIDVSDELGELEYEIARLEAQEKNRNLGYTEKPWDKITYKKRREEFGI